MVLSAVARVTAVQVGPVVVNLITNGDRVASMVERHGDFEPQSLAKWAEICSPGDVVLDIGAYTGIYSIAARLLGCHVIAFEPMAQNRQRFVENAKLNEVSNKVNEEAVSDRVGAAAIIYNPIPFTSGASLVRGLGRQRRPVKTVSLDSLNLPSVAAIKIDVERAEPLVLAGAREMLARCRPAMLVEVLGEAEGQAVLAAVEDYRVAATLDGRNWLMLPA